MKKIYISANELLADAFKLAAEVYDSDFRPSLILGVLRGGGPISIAVHEYFQHAGIAAEHISIQASSYTGINQQHPRIQLQGLDLLLDKLKPQDRLLIVDDVFDSGRSINAVLSQIRSGVQNQKTPQIRIACPWYKPSKNLTDICPDYYLRETDQWLVFPHELVGLNTDEIRDAKGKKIASLLR